MLILGIETSCDETSAAVVKEGHHILSNVVSSQIDLHRPFGGVVPELASRHHTEKISSIVSKAIEEACIKPEDIDAIAVTHGPGLVGSLIVGIMFARGFGEGLSCPVLGINHLEGHLFASIMEHSDLSFPFLALLVSGGHTLIVAVNKVGHYDILGQTIDDAAGEAFDKVANILKLGYPGGPAIDKLTQKIEHTDRIPFPRPLLKADSYDFSFSGLKTAVLYHSKKTFCNAPETFPEKEVSLIATSFQDAVVETLVTKTFSALEKSGLKQCALGGGVAANESLRKQFLLKGKEKDISIFLPSKKNCTDNAAMIACCAYYRWQHNVDRGKSFEVDPRLKL